MDVYFYKYNCNGKYIVIIKIIFQKNDLYIYKRTEQEQHLDEWIVYVLQFGDSEFWRVWMDIYVYI
jgi:hypothetical protein